MPPKKINKEKEGSVCPDRLSSIKSMGKRSFSELEGHSSGWLQGTGTPG
jgi:hypothetical protein